MYDPSAPSQDDRKFLEQHTNKVTDTRCEQLPSDWAENHRYLSAATSPQPGRWRNETTPYIKEILDCLSDESPVREIVWVKGAQIGATVSLLENAIGWTIAESPCAMMYVTSSDALAKSRMQLHIDAMIDDSGLRDKIRAQRQPSAHGRARVSGDTQNLKEFRGGFLISASMASAHKARSESVKRLFLDEIDAGKETLGDEGDPISLFKNRTAAYEATRKIVYLSTPLIKHTSRIDELYLLGDQRRYYVPCLKCGYEQYLDWVQLKYETITDKNKRQELVLDSTYYECINCHSGWNNSDKIFFMPEGVWKPTKKSRRPHLVSYHLSSLYSPVGFRSWETCAQQWIEAQNKLREGDPRPLQVVVNTVLGEPWEERGDVPKYERVMLRRDDYTYTTGAIPDSGPLFLTCGVDVHETHIRAEKVAWGRDAVSWSHSIRSIQGNIGDEKTWESLKKYLIEEEYTNKGRRLQLEIACVDSRYGTEDVIDFCAVMENTIPIRGVQVPPGQSWGVPFQEKPIKGHKSLKCLALDVFWLKDWFYYTLKLGLGADGVPPDRFAHFPIDYKEQYFRELTAEQKLLKRDRLGRQVYVYEQIGSRANHFLDCRVYAIAGLYYYAHVCQGSQGAILWNDFWSMMENKYK